MQMKLTICIGKKETQYFEIINKNILADSNESTIL